jgi:drug/metabolite transporter (DMT)-like permease
MWVAVIAAVLAGASFAAAGVLQQRVASTRPEGEKFSLALLGHLARQRLWLAGIALAFLSYGFQSLALAFAPLSVVQPLIVTELIFALPLSAALHHVRLSARDWAGALAVAGGLAVAIVAASPGEGDTRAPLSGWVWTLVAVASLALVALVLGRRSRGGPLQASLLALAAGSVMGTQSALLDSTIDTLQEGFVPLVTSWQTYLLIVASIGGLQLIQSAYAAGPLGASLPVMDAIEPAVAVTIGVLLFGEAIAEGALRRGIAGAALAVVVVGIVLLDTSPVIQRLHSQERSQQRSEEDDEQVGLRGP